jgi:hypothetical protein
MASSHEAAPTAAPRRRRPRGQIIAPDRITGMDMRSHQGRKYSQASRPRSRNSPAANRRGSPRSSDSGCSPLRLRQPHYLAGAPPTLRFGWQTSRRGPGTRCI